jgi:hypothetical protein
VIGFSSGQSKPCVWWLFLELRSECTDLSVLLAYAALVRQRARCDNCGVKGNNTYQIVYTGNSDVAMDGAGVMMKP